MNSIPMRIDSHSTLRNIENPLSRGRTRTLEFRYHFVREIAMTDEDLQEGHTNGKRIKFVWVASKDQIAVIFTKIWCPLTI